MRSKETSTYTITCMIIGLVAGFAYYFFQNEPSENILQYLFGTSYYFLHPDMASIALWHSLAGVSCLGICWVSSRLDFFNPSDDHAGTIIRRSIKAWIWLLGMVLFFAFTESMKSATRVPFPFAEMIASYLPTINEDSSFLSRLFTGLFVLVFNLIFVLLNAIFGILSAILLFIISPVTLGLGVAALLCMPRALIYSNTVSKLRAPVEQARGSGMISPHRVVSGVGEKSTSAAHAVAVRKDLNAQLEEARRVEARLKAEEERLSKAMHHDTKRLKEEAELLKVLEEIDRYKLRIKTLEAAQRKQAR